MAVKVYNCTTLKADSHVAGRLQIRIRRPLNGHHKNRIFLALILKHAQRPQPYNLLSFMLHELVFFEYHSRFASYLHSFAWYSYSGKILQPHVAVTVRMHSDAVFSCIRTSCMKTVVRVRLINK